MMQVTYIGRTGIGAWFGVSGDAVRKWQERHADFPAPDAVTDGRTPGWLPEREQEIRKWRANLPGQGAAGRPKPRRQPE